MKGKCGILGRVFGAVARLEVSVIAVAQGASELSICFAVPVARGAEVVRAVHDEFCEQIGASIPLCIPPTVSLVSEAQ